MRLIQNVVLCLWLMLQGSEAAQILGLFAFPGKSSFDGINSVMSELARRGHNVTVYSSNRLFEKMERLQEIIIEPQFPFWKTVLKNAGKTKNLYELNKISEDSMEKHLGATGYGSVEYFLNNHKIQELLKLPTKDFNYDLIVVDLFYTEALLTFGHLHNKPTIGIVSSNFDNYMQKILNSFIPMACTPISFETEFSAISEKGYWTRLFNIRDCMQRRRDFKNYHEITQQELVAKYFGQLYSAKAEQLPTLGTLHAHLAVLLLNNHVPLMQPRPLLLNTITAGGFHIRPTRDLPWHIKRFLDEARNGAIYMNLGNEHLCADIPNSLLNILFEVLGKLKESVLWTCHDVDKLNAQPKNIMIQHAISQTDILAHPHVKVFITNGDLMSIQEGIVRHVPMLGIPVFRHEISGMQIAVQLGVALTLPYDDVTIESLNWALKNLLVNHEISDMIRIVARKYRDRPLGALETTMYWMEYVMRFNGGTHLKTRGIGDSTSSQLHLFDLFLFYFSMSLFIISIAVVILLGALYIWKRHETHKILTKLN